MTRPFAPACERNRDPILGTLRPAFADRQNVLEIGSGTGQHAVYFAPRLPQLRWQTSDLAENHPGILAWLAQEPAPNVLPPLELDMAQANWFAGLPGRYDAVFSANTCHIMSWPQVENMFSGIGQLLPAGGVVAVYGPFNDQGLYTSEGNARFDQALRSSAAHMGLRDWQAVDGLARQHGLALRERHAMPANNMMLVWDKA